MMTTMQHLAMLSNIGYLDSTYIVVWPNGSWCHPDELEQFGHLSDDAQRWFYRNDEYSEDELEQAAAMISNGCSSAFVHYALQDNRQRILKFRRPACSSGA